MIVHIEVNIETVTNIDTDEEVHDRDRFYQDAEEEIRQAIEDAIYGLEVEDNEQEHTLALDLNVYVPADQAAEVA